MPRPSTIDRQPEEIRQKIAALRDQGRTIDEILAALDRLDVDISRSALGRYVKNMDQVAERVRNSRALADAISRQFGDKETSKVARTNMELMHSILMKVMVGDPDSDQDVTLTPMEAMLMSKSLDHLAKAGKADFEVQLKAAVEEERRASVQKAAEKAVTAAKKQGLSAETVQAIKASILGVA